jgi:hypothetical protein
MDRFWNKVDQSGDCWEWMASKNHGGYGFFHYQGVCRLAHRVSHILHGGDIPNGMSVCHRCDNPGCVNPNHLFIGTHLDNMRDMYSKGRRVAAVGQQNGKTKLTDHQVIEIYNSTDTNIADAKRHNICATVVSRIKSGQRWAYLTRS